MTRVNKLSIYFRKLIFNCEPVCLRCLNITYISDNYHASYRLLFILSHNLIKYFGVVFNFLFSMASDWQMFIILVNLFNYEPNFIYFPKPANVADIFAWLPKHIPQQGTRPTYYTYMHIHSSLFVFWSLLAQTECQTECFFLFWYLRFVLRPKEILV